MGFWASKNGNHSDGRYFLASRKCVKKRMYAMFPYKQEGPVSLPALCQFNRPTTYQVFDLLASISLSSSFTASSICWSRPASRMVDWLATL